MNTRTDLAERFNISRQTLSNWEKEKPELIRIINLGLATEEHFGDVESYFSKLKEIQTKSSNSKKLHIKGKKWQSS